MGAKKTSKTANRGVSQRVRQQIAVGALSAVMPVRDAQKLTGYAVNSNLSPLAAETTEQIRARLQQTPGYRIDDSARFYKKIRESKSEDTDTKIRANTRLDKILGHDAPIKQEITETREITASISVLHSLCSRLGVNPLELKQAVNSDYPTAVNSDYPTNVTDNVNAQACIYDKSMQINDIQTDATDCRSVESKIETATARRSRSKKAMPGGAP